MNGGYAVIVELAPKHGRATLEAALASIAISEGFELELLELEQAEADALVDAREPRIVFGVQLVGRLAILVPRDKFDALGAQALGAALASWLDGPVAWVLHNDDDAVSMGDWNGGDRLEADSGMLSFGDSPIEWYVEFVPRALEPVKAAWAKSLLEALATARTPAMQEVELRFTQVASRPRGGPLSQPLDDLQLSGTVGGKPFSVLTQRGRPSDTVDEALRRTEEALGRFDFPEHLRGRQVPASPAQLRTVRRQLPADVRLDALSRVGPPGFHVSHAEWRARGALAGEPFELTFFERYQTELGEALSDGLEALRASREADARADLTERYLTAMQEGDFERAARDYARLHFGDRAGDADVVEQAKKKIDELARLYGFRPRG